MTQYIVLFDDTKQTFVRSVETIQSVSGADYNVYDSEVGAGGQSVFTVAESLIDRTLDIFVNGILQRLGASNDYTITDAAIRVIKAASAADYNHYDVGAGGQTQFVMTSGTIEATNKLEVFENGIVKREGSSYDFERNTGSNAIDFTYTVPENAWVLVKVYDN
jgi:hypothetical protein